MRFAKEMQTIAFALETQHGFNILQCVYGDGEHLTPEQRAKLALAHAQGKEVLFHTDFHR